jgi:cytochrome c oxidase subunit 2
MGKFQLYPDAASTIAPHWDALNLYLCLVTLAFTTLIAVLVVVFSIVFRRRSEDERPAETKTNAALEIAWIAIPFVLVMVMFAWGAVVYVEYDRVPANAMEINVVGKQWMWKIEHADGQREINELHVPIGQPVKLVMTSQDVIHDFAIPIFRIKKDVLPGRYTTEWFEATKAGTGWIFCDQYCGTQHSRMVGKVTVMEPADYQAWLSGQIRGLTPSEEGQELFKQYSCINCHSQEAPTMANLFGSKVKVWDDGKLIEITADENYITDSILEPNHQIVEGYKPLMPSFKDRLSAEQLQELVAYIKSLGNQGGRVDEYKMNNRYVPAGPVQPADTGGLTK